jgi:predicted RNA binding protein YcfA (HicA-like mRNA interferase family)
MKYHECIRILKRHGYKFDRQGKGCHEIWRKPETNETILISRHPLVARARANWLQNFKAAT